MMCKIGVRLGADIPFCIVGGSAFADGKGDILHSFPSMPDCTLVIACGGEGVSTPVAYGEIDKIYGGFEEDSSYEPKSLKPLLKAAEKGDLYAIASNTFNIFEEPMLAIRPVAAQLKNIMLSCGAVGAMMSGSGPSIFGIFDNDTSVSIVCEKIKEAGVTPHVCKPLNI